MSGIRERGRSGISPIGAVSSFLFSILLSSLSIRFLGLFCSDFLFLKFIYFRLLHFPGRSKSPVDTLSYPLVHQFFVPVRDKPVVKPRRRTQKQAVDKLTEQEREQEQAGHTTARYRVFGMTARMLVDVARVAYAEEPEFEHNSHFGDEDMISRLRKIGRLSAMRKPSDELTKEDMQRAAKLS